MDLSSKKSGIYEKESRRITLTSIDSWSVSSAEFYNNSNTDMKLVRQININNIKQQHFWCPPIVILCVITRNSSLNILNIPMQLLTPDSLKLLTFPYGLKPPDRRSQLHISCVFHTNTRIDRGDKYPISNHSVCVCVSLCVYSCLSCIMDSVL